MPELIEMKISQNKRLVKLNNIVSQMELLDNDKSFNNHEYIESKGVCPKFCVNGFFPR